MTNTPGMAITSLLVKWKEGDRGVENQLATLVYPVLRDIARRQVFGRSGAVTLRPTELVNEAYERIADQKAVDWQNRAHFFGIAATVLRRVLIDHIRQRMTEKQGGDVCFVALDHPDADTLASPGDVVDWLALDQVLTQLEQHDPASARVVEMRLFSGLSVEQIAEVCDSSTATVGRQWRFARVWMAARLGADGHAAKTE
ncbi:MAG: sigma-70 family RNA polymerase sigma factor [Rhodanobacteraceae bacterium]|nr:sigma-70 family RNA polymerase sigma factor [Rhodanobacteraceae bacterium]